MQNEKLLELLDEEDSDEDNVIGIPEDDAPLAQLNMNHQSNRSFMGLDMGTSSAIVDQPAGAERADSNMSTPAPLLSGSSFVNRQSRALGETSTFAAASLRDMSYFGSYDAEELDDRTRKAAKNRVVLTKKSNLSVEISNVFQFLDPAGTGKIGKEDLAERLIMRPFEALALIHECKSVLKKSKGESNDTLTLEEFRELLEMEQDELDRDLNSIPPRQLKRYRDLFDSMDVDQGGTIGAEELEVFGFGGGVGNAFGGKSEINFEDFAMLIRGAEVGKGARTIISLLMDNDDFPEGQRLAEHFAKKVEKDKHNANASKNPMAINLGLLQDSGRKIAAQEAPQVVKDIWDSAEPGSDGLAVTEDVKRALINAHDTGEILADDADIMQTVMDLEAKGESIVFDQFWQCLSEFVDGDELDYAFTGATSQSSYSSNASSIFAATDLLAPEELALFRQTFDRLDVHQETTVHPGVLLEATTALTTHAELPNDSMVFMFHMIPSINYHLEMNPSFDFELFVTVIQEAAINTKEDLGNASWEPLESVAFLYNNMEAAVIDQLAAMESNTAKPPSANASFRNSAAVQSFRDSFRNKKGMPPPSIAVRQGSGLSDDRERTDANENSNFHDLMPKLTQSSSVLIGCVWQPAYKTPGVRLRFGLNSSSRCCVLYCFIQERQT